MNELQLGARSIQSGLASGTATVDDARVWAIDAARIIGADDVMAALSLMLVTLSATDEQFLEFINGLTDDMLEPQKVQQENSHD